MSLHGDLREQAGHLATREAGKPKQASLRRAVSTAYYALFHLLIEESTRQTLGLATSRRGMRQALARGYSHNVMLRACQSFAGGSLPHGIHAAAGGFIVPTDLRVVADAFRELQNARHRADYNLAVTFTRSEVLRLIRLLDAALAAWQRVRGRDEARFFLAVLPMWDSLRS